MTAVVLKARMQGFSTAYAEEFSHRLNQAAERSAAAAAAVELHTGDGRTAHGRDGADAQANLSLQLHLVARAKRGRSAMIADILGCLEGDAAISRGKP